MCITIYLFISAYLISCNRSVFINSSPLKGKSVRQARKLEFPFVVSIQNIVNNYTQNHICGGTLISIKHVLTSAHCLNNEVVETLLVSIGSVNWRCGKKYKLKSWLTYDEWAAENHIQPEYHDNDIAVITLSEDVNDAVVYPAVFPKPGKKSPYKKHVIAVGWGATNGGQYPNVLNEVSLDVIKPEECKRNLKILTGEIVDLPRNILCTTGKPRAVIGCGDSGSPLIADRMVIIGISDSSCPRNNADSIYSQNLHMSVNYYTDFIMDAIRPE